MRWTNDQKAAKILTDEFGAPPEPWHVADFKAWAERIADYINQNPPPQPQAHREYLVDNGEGSSHVGTCVGTVPGSDALWVFLITTTDGSREYEEHDEPSIYRDYDEWLNDPQRAEHKEPEDPEDTVQIPRGTLSDLRDQADEHYGAVMMEEAPE